MKVTKIDNIGIHLLINKTITPIEALQQYGSFRLSNQIRALKKLGFKIKTTLHETKKYGIYTLIDINVKDLNNFLKRLSTREDIDPRIIKYIINRIKKLEF